MDSNFGGPHGISDADSGEGLSLTVPNADMFQTTHEPISQAENSLNLFPIFSSEQGQEKLTEIFDASRWFNGHWEPEAEHDQVSEERYLSLSAQDCPDQLDPTQAHPPILPATRSRILAMVIEVCCPENIEHVLSGFPTTDILEILLQDFLIWQSHEPDTWIHIPTFQTNEMQTGLLAACIAIGAAKASCAAVRKFGLAMYDILHSYLFKIVGVCLGWKPFNRRAIANKYALLMQCDKQVMYTRDIQYVQALALQVQLGLLSGDKKKLEVSRAVVGTFVTVGSLPRQEDYEKVTDTVKH